MEFFTNWMRILKSLIHNANDGEPFYVGSVLRSIPKKTYLLLLALSISFGIQSNLNAQTNLKGVAPLLQPIGGLAIDGNAYVNSPGDDPDAGDWLFENGDDPENADPGGVFPPDASDGVAEGIPDAPYPDDFYLYPNQTTFFRDNITNNDPSIFTGSNKINDNPNTYTWGTGSSPNKNEIQNAIAHFSFADANILYGVEGELWLAFAADRQVTNGSSYIDFEILQMPLTKEPDGTFSSLGEDGGRTVDDLLITIEFTNGGGAAQVVVRQWQENDAGDGFIYNIITPEMGTVFGTENDVKTIVPYSVYFQDPINEEGFYEYDINQWAEGAVNLSYFFGDKECITLSTLFVRTRTSGNSEQSELKDFPGPPTEIEIDLTPDAPELTDQAVCDIWDDSLEATGCDGIVKWYEQEEGGEVVYTGSSFPTGELTITKSYWASCTVNDCEGPRAKVTITIYNSPDLMVEDLEACEYGTTGAYSFNLNDGVTDADGGTLSFYESEANAEAGTGAIDSPLDFSVNIGSDEIWVRSDSEDDGDETCYSIESFMIYVYDNPDFDVTDLASCQADDVETAEFDLNDAVSNKDDGTLKFYNSEAEALVPENSIADPTKVVVSQAGDTFWARLDNDADSDEGCYTIKSFDVDVYDNPDLVVEDLAACEDGITGANSFNLNDGVTDADGGTLSFYESEANAEAGTGAIDSPLDFSVNIGSDEIWVRSDSEDDGDETCYSIESFMIYVYDNPDFDVTDLASCQADDVETAEFDLNDAVSNKDDGTLKFYNSEAEALVPENPIADPTKVEVSQAGDTFWARLDNDADGDEGCYTIKSFDVDVYDNPDLMVQPLSDCEDGMTGANSFNLNDGVTDADGGTLSFYESEANAEAGTGAIDSPLSFSVNIGSDEIWVRSDSEDDGDETCYSIASFMIYVYDNPDVTTTNPGTICYGESIDLSLYVSADGGSVSYHTTQDDADDNLNALSGSVVSPEVGTTIYYVRSQTTNGDNVCYGTATITVIVEQCAQEGCTLGYWKNHTNKWCDAYTTCTLYETVFTNAPQEFKDAELTLLEALNLGGGGIYNLARQSVAALLNTCSSGVAFTYANVNILIADVNYAFTNGEAEYFGSYLDGLNMAGCPLGGSNATTEPSDSCIESITAPSESEASGFSVSPVPFKEQLSIQYHFDYTSNVNIQLFSISGRMLQNFNFKGVSAGDINDLNLGFTVIPSQAYIIKLNTDRESFSKTIMSSD